MCNYYYPNNLSLIGMYGLMQSRACIRVRQYQFSANTKPARKTNKAEEKKNKRNEQMIS